MGEITLEKSILTLKILRKLIVHGLKKPHEHAEAMAFVSRLFDEVKVLLELRRGTGAPLRENLEKYTVLCEKIWTDLLGKIPIYYRWVTYGTGYHLIGVVRPLPLPQGCFLCTFKMVISYLYLNGKNRGLSTYDRNSLSTAVYRIYNSPK